MPVCASCGHEAAEAFKFCPECGAPATAVPFSREQRKTVTVLFCDVIGSTALGESTDPEALRAVLARYFERMKGIVESHGGTVEKFIRVRSTPGTSRVARGQESEGPLRGTRPSCSARPHALAPSCEREPGRKGPDARAGAPFRARLLDCWSSAAVGADGDAPGLPIVLLSTPPARRCVPRLLREGGSPTRIEKSPGKRPFFSCPLLSVEAEKWGLWRRTLSCVPRLLLPHIRDRAGLDVAGGDRHGEARARA